MAYRILADLVLILHFCFVLFVVFGGLFVVRRRWVASLHLPAVVWGVLVECFFWACPLTTLENSLRQKGRSRNAGSARGRLKFGMPLKRVI